MNQDSHTVEPTKEEPAQRTRKRMRVEIVVEIPYDSRINADERMMDPVRLQPMDPALKKTAAPRGHSLFDILPEGSKRKRRAVVYFEVEVDHRPDMCYKHSVQSSC